MSGKIEIHSELSRDLTLFQVTMMGLGMMIGAGVFIGIGTCTGLAGPGGVMLTFTLNGLIALFTAMSYAELSSAIPRAGGAYNFARIGFGRRTSFIAGWMEWFASSLAGSFYAITFALYTVDFFYWVFKFEPTGIIHLLTIKLVAVLAAIFFICVNYRGASETGKLGTLITIGQTSFLLIIGAIGLVVAIKDPSRLENFTPFMPNGWGKILITMGFIYVAFEGYEVIAQAGDEVVDPKKNLPKAMLYSVLIVTCTYILVTFATLISVKASPELTVNGAEVAPWQWIGSFGPKGFEAGVARLLPAPVYAKIIVILAVIFSSTSALNATIYSATRASYALGRDRMLPGFFARISSKRKTPWVALVFTGAIVIITAAVLPTEDIGSSASIMFLILFFLVNLCVIKIRRSMCDELTYGYLMPLFPFIPIAAVICQAILIAWMHEFSMIAVTIAVIWVIGGFIIYSLYSKSRAVATEDEILVFEEEQPHPDSGQFKVMLAVANPASTLALVKNTYRICSRKNAALELLHMVPVPEAVALSDADRYKFAGKEGIMEIMLYLEGHFKINTTLRYCRNIARGIVSALREKRIKMLIMGWHGKPQGGLFTIGSTVDPVIERAYCDVVIMKNCQDGEYKNILVPVAGGPNSALALETACLLADEQNTRVTLFSVVNDRFKYDPALLVRKCEELAIPLDHITSRTVFSDKVEETILKEASEYDLVVIGASRKGALSHVFHGSLPEQIAAKCHKPLVMVSASRGIGSWLKKWF